MSRRVAQGIAEGLNDAIAFARGDKTKAHIHAPCVVCGDDTILACSDCAIDTGGVVAVHVCKKPECRDAHEALHNIGGQMMTAPSPLRSDTGE